VFDATFRENFMVGPLMTKAMKPDSQIPKKWFDEGFVAKADTIRELADTSASMPMVLKKPLAR
jgi:3-oxosteroid 1-dehydrogenase